MGGNFGTVINCSVSDCTIQSVEGSAGGLMGQNGYYSWETLGGYGFVKACYAEKSSVMGNIKVGGLVGHNFYGEIHYSYSFQDLHHQQQNPPSTNHPSLSYYQVHGMVPKTTNHSLQHASRASAPSHYASHRNSRPDTKSKRPAPAKAVSFNARSTAAARRRTLYSLGCQFSNSVIY